MAYLEPEEILENRGQYSVKAKAAREMIKRYGFVFRYSSGSHATYAHPDFPDLKIVSPGINGRKDLDPGDATFIAEVCLMAKERKKQEKKEVGSGEDLTLPAWLTNGIPKGFQQRVDDDGIMHITHAANGSVARSYTIQNIGGRLQVQSVELPDEDFSILVPFSNHDRMPGRAFGHAFSELDETVRGLLAQELPTDVAVSSPATSDPEATDPAPSPAETEKPTTQPSMSDRHAPRKASPQKVTAHIEAALNTKITTIDGEPFTLADALDAGNFIVPAVQPDHPAAFQTIGFVSVQTDEVKATLKRMATAIEVGNATHLSAAKEALKANLLSYKAVLEAALHMRHLHGKGPEDYGYLVIDNDKYNAAVSLPLRATSIVDSMQANDRGRV